ncbi:hypothetical protein [Portibacter marinus]|uniref:hypothetical protein n=1 Tax=Portibacter marinus TaxID=2898660 RepID=UPI001F3315E2|nr:hypothetical protein [Portibacter marinus]
MLKFDTTRVRALFTREFYLGYLPAIKAASIIILAVFVINLIARIADPQNGGNDEESGTLLKFGIILMIGGLLYASWAFKEFRKVSTRAAFLALPGSSFEKTFVKWLFTNPIFILTISLLILVASLIFTPLIHKFGGDAYMNEIFLSEHYWRIVGIYFIVHSIFFFGSIAFNRVAGIQTIVFLILLGIVSAILCAIFFRIVWADMFSGLFTFAPQEGNFRFGDGSREPEDMWQVQFFIFAFKYLLAPALWAASIFKLSEKQV